MVGAMLLGFVGDRFGRKRMIVGGFDAFVDEKADGQCAIDYAFHMIMADVNEGSLKEMEGLVGEGITSFKLFMAYPGVLYVDDGTLYRAFRQAGENGTRICMHAENGIVIDEIVKAAVKDASELLLATDHDPYVREAVATAVPTSCTNAAIRPIPSRFNFSVSSLGRW